MEGPQQWDTADGDLVEEHKTDPPQGDMHEQGQFDLDEKAVESPGLASRSEPGLGASATNVQSDPVVKRFIAALNNRDNLQSVLDEHPDFLYKDMRNFADPPLQYIIRSEKVSEDWRLGMIRQLVQHDYRLRTTFPVTGETGRATGIVRHTGWNGRPALHAACSRGLLKIADYLMQKGADIHAVDKDGNTALHYACRSGQVKTAEYLLKRGAKINAVTTAGNTALLLAAYSLNESMVNLLLRYKANPNAVTRVGKGRNGEDTALHKAALRSGDSKIVDMLLRADADVDPRNHFGATPLHEAARAGNEPAARRLLDEGAEVDARTAKKWTPLHHAAYQGHPGTVELLLKFGASTSSRTRDGLTPERLASKANHSDVVKMLHQDELLRQSLFGRSPKLSKPNANQKRLCGKFAGMVWPKIGDNPNFNLSVKEMLYGGQEEGPLLRQLQSRGHATWIHLPANNMVWVEDVLKLIYQAPDPNTTAGSEQQDKDNGKAASQNLLPKTLHFIEAHINETSQVNHARQPHFRSAQGPKPRPRDDHMISMVLPVIDTDMQQPRFYMPGRDEELSGIWDEAEGAKTTSWHKSTRPHETRPTNDEEQRLRRVQEYTTSEGRSLTESETSHVKDMEDLEKAYRSIHFVRTLDESFHEILDERDLNERNGDQVVSRYLARFRAKWEEESASREKSPAKHTHEDHAGLNKSPEEDGVKEGESDQIMGKEHNSLQNDGVQVTAARLGQDNTSSGSAEQIHNAPKTPSELENQQQPTKTARKSTMWGYILDRPFFSRPKAKKPDSSNSLDTSGSTGRDRGKAQQDVDRLPNRDESGEESEGEHDSQDMTPRQQILVVPQLWLWKFEDTIITAFPDRWDSSNSQTLPQKILESLQRRSSIKKYTDNDSPDMKVHEVLSTIVETALEFEPLFSVPNNQRNYYEAFAGEIAFVSGQVAHSYYRYRKSLGRTADSFAQGVQQETEYLVMVDDILSELAMIRRVEQDQNLVGAAIMAHLRSRYDKQGPKNRPASAGAGWMESFSPIDDTLNNAMYQTQNRAAKLDRQVEDALRVRNSIITLLDLRQRQASTENALESGRQSQMLFAQSKVLFIFTAATVIFAPLSWISSLMALKIDNFTPDAWSRAETFGASFVSLVSTILLCLLGWQVYDRYASRDGAASESEPPREQYSMRTGIAETNAGLAKKGTERGRHFLENRPRRRPRNDRY